VCDANWTATNGLVTLEGPMPAILRSLDSTLLRFAQAMKAREITFPAITPVTQLCPIDYFKNFPHLGLAVSALDPAHFGEDLEHASLATGYVTPDSLGNAKYFLPSAACYPIYAHLRDRTIVGTQYITTVQRCFRNETHYDGMRRLLGFTMREIVAVGTYEDVRDFLEIGKQCVLSLANAAGLPLEVQKAHDPFFSATNEKSRTQKLLGLKQELVFEDAVAISSVNAHMGFFGERWRIRLDPAHYAFSGCIAFGLERWLHALAKTHNNETASMLRAIQLGETAALHTLDAGLPKRRQPQLEMPGVQ